MMMEEELECLQLGSLPSDAAAPSEDPLVLCELDEPTADEVAEWLRVPPPSY